MKSKRKGQREAGGFRSYYISPLAWEIPHKFWKAEFNYCIRKLLSMMDVLDLESWEEQSMTLESWEGQSMTLVKHQQQMWVQNSLWQYPDASGHTSSLGPWSFSQFPLISPEPYCQKRRIKHRSSHSHYILIDQLKKDFLVLHIELCMKPAHNMLPVNFLINPEQNGILGLGLLQWELAGRMGQLKGE